MKTVFTLVLATAECMSGSFIWAFKLAHDLPRLTAFTLVIILILILTALLYINSSHEHLLIQPEMFNNAKFKL